MDRGLHGGHGRHEGQRQAWKPYLASDDMTKTIEAAEAAGAEVLSGRLGGGRSRRPRGARRSNQQATIGLWQAGTWPGFSVVDEHGARAGSSSTPTIMPTHCVYQGVFGLEVNAISDTDEFRYSTLRRSGEEADLAGICDDSKVVPEELAHWAIYWELDDVDWGTDKVRSLGGTVYSGATSTPYGRSTVVADPSGAKFMLRTRGA